MSRRKGLKEVLVMIMHQPPVLLLLVLVLVVASQMQSQSYGGACHRMACFGSPACVRVCLPSHLPDAMHRHTEHRRTGCATKERKHRSSCTRGLCIPVLIPILSLTSTHRHTDNNTRDTDTPLLTSACLHLESSVSSSPLVVVVAAGVAVGSAIDCNHVVSLPSPHDPGCMCPRDCDTASDSIPRDLGFQSL